uniref:Uncharacterized protein n=2 Tax=Cacopsylla melanoneura TaxID=428564 RepID=A0A8D8VC56_9HEMI
MRMLTKAQKRQIRRRNFKKQSQDSREGDGEQKDEGNLYNVETNHIEDKAGNKVSTKSNKDTKSCKTNDSTKLQATTSDTTTHVGEKKRLKRKISTNNNKTNPNETDMGAGDNGLNKHAQQVFKKYDEQYYSKFVQQKTKFSASGNCQENGIPIGKPCLNKKVNKGPVNCQKNASSGQPINKESLNKVDTWLKSNQFSKTSLNEDDSNSQTKENDIAMLAPRKRNNIVNGHHSVGGGDFYH